MARGWEEALERWCQAGLIDPAAADRIRSYEALRGGGPRWPVRLVVALGGLLLSAGVLLFVAAHWAAIGPAGRFALLLGTVTAFHLGGAAVAGRWSVLSATLHACGTAALGGGIFLAGQIFNLSTHWPTGLFLWGASALLGWALLRQWPQAAIAALAGPAWLFGEWSVATESLRAEAVGSAGLLAFALAYLGALPARRAAADDAAARRAIAWVGGLAVIPAAVVHVLVGHERPYAGATLPGTLALAGWTVALGTPLAVGWALRGRLPAALAALVAWTFAGPLLIGARGAAPYFWSASLALGLVGWGVTERRTERINLGVAGFAIVVLVFYFSDVMDRLGRSASLVGLGVLFLAGGWVLERARRGLVSRVAAEER